MLQWKTALLRICGHCRLVLRDFYKTRPKMGWVLKGGRLAKNWRRRDKYDQDTDKSLKELS